MRWAQIAGILVITAGCDKGQKPADPPRPAPPTPAVGPPIDAAPVVDAPPPIDAAPAIPADLTAAPAWSGRSYYTGKIRATAVHTTATLQRVDSRALLTLEVREQALHLNGKDPDPFGAPTKRQILATWKDDKLEYQDKEPVSLPCAVKTVKVAGAAAIRVREGKGGCEGDQGKWKPGATRAQKALVCGDPTSEMDPSFTFVEPPAAPIEYLWVNDDCSMQGGGYRDVPKDGSIASPR